MTALPYYFCYTLPLMFAASLYLGGIWLLLPVAFAFIAIPLLDTLFGRDSENLTKEQEEKVKNAFSFRLVTYLWVPCQIAIVIVGAWYASTQNDWWEILLVIIGAGVNTGGLGITIGHELAHRQGKFEQWCAQVVLAFRTTLTSILSTSLAIIKEFQLH